AGTSCSGQDYFYPAISSCSQQQNLHWFLPQFAEVLHTHHSELHCLGPDTSRSHTRPTLTPYSEVAKHSPTHLAKTGIPVPSPGAVPNLQLRLVLQNRLIRRRRGLVPSGQICLIFSRMQ